MTAAPTRADAEQRTRVLTHYTAEASVALRIEQLEAALRKYGQHDYSVCKSMGLNGHGVPVKRGNCTCGLDAALANVEAARTGANT